MLLSFVRREIASTHGEDEIAGMRRDDRRADDAPARHDDLGEAMGLAFRLRPVVVVQRPARHRDREALRARLRLGQPDMRKLGIRERAPRNGRSIRLRRNLEQHAANDEPRVIARDMRELQPAGDVADRHRCADSRCARPASTSTPLREYFTPAASRLSPSTFAARPAASSRCDPATASLCPLRAIVTATPPSDFATAVTAAFSRMTTPSRSSA